MSGVWDEAERENLLSHQSIVPGRDRLRLGMTTYLVSEARQNELNCFVRAMPVQ
jgi:hypothetical protein